MSKYGGSEKNNTSFFFFFDAAYNKPKLSTRSAQAEGAPLASSSARWGEDESSIPPLPLHSGLLQPWTDVWGVDDGGDSPCWLFYRTLPSQGYTAVLRHLSPQQIELLCALGPRHLLKNNIQFVFFYVHRLPLLLLHFFLLLKPNTGPE